MKYGKPILGIIMIALALMLMFFWETSGRQMVTTSEVLVAAMDIKDGEILEESKIKVAKTLNENLMKDCLLREQMQIVIGEKTNCDIFQNQQLSRKYFLKSKNKIKKDYTLFTLYSHWMKNLSSSVRKGDLIDIYTARENIYLGNFRVAFAKDNANHEVVDEGKPKSAECILDRTDSNLTLDHIEIEATLQDYMQISSYGAIEEEGLIIVQREEED